MYDFFFVKMPGVDFAHCPQSDYLGLTESTATTTVLCNALRLPYTVAQWLLFGIFVQKVFETNLNFRSE